MLNFMAGIVRRQPGSGLVARLTAPQRKGDITGALPTVRAQSEGPVTWTDPGHKKSQPSIPANCTD